MTSRKQRIAQTRALARKQRCNAKSKQSGKQCRAWAMPNGKCYYHGGAQKRGLEHHSTTHGMYSSHTPTRYKERADELRENKELLNMREDVVLLTMRLQSLSEKMDVGDYGSSYMKLQKLYARSQQNLQAALYEKNERAMQDFIDYFNEIGIVIQRGANDYELWQEIAERVHDRRQVISEISKIEYRGQKAVTLESLMMLMGKLAEHFNRVNHIVDADERRQAFRDGQDSLLRLVE